MSRQMHLKITDELHNEITNHAIHWFQTSNQVPEEIKGLDPTKNHDMSQIRNLFMISNAQAYNQTFDENMFQEKIRLYEDNVCLLKKDCDQLKQEKAELFTENEKLLSLIKVANKTVNKMKNQIETMVFNNGSLKKHNNALTKKVNGFDSLQEMYETTIIKVEHYNKLLNYAYTIFSDIPNWILFISGSSKIINDFIHKVNQLPLEFNTNKETEQERNKKNG